ncbi:transposase [Candidatus Poribacteria bacterium]|nr:transposase [Candidatus Poribacteria bacterium]
MPEIIALFTVLNPCLSTTTLRQLCQVVFALLAMTGQVTMLNIPRWTSKGGSYRTIQRFFSTDLTWPKMCWLFFKNYLFDPESEYLLVADEVIVSKSVQKTFGIDRFFFSVYGKAIPGLSFLAMSLVSVKDRRSYPMMMEQVVRVNASDNTNVSAKT